MNARRRLAQLPAETESRRHNHYQQAELDIDLLAIEEVYRVVLEVRICQDAVDVKERSGPVRGEMERLPFFSAQLTPEVRGHDYEGQ